MDYKGLDLPDYPSVDSADKCKEACNLYSTCRFWTWVKTIKKPHANCYLKDSILNRTANKTTISGLRNCNSKQA